MKKLVLITSVLTLISTSAMASQARLLALGMKETDNDGMYHVSDARNIFLNPAYVNIYNNYVTTEYGRFGVPAAIDATTGSAATLDNSAAPKAQGGFFTKQGDMVYGLYLGNESNTSSLLRIFGTSAIATMDKATDDDGTGAASKMLQSTDNQVDLFIGGDAGIKWGANALFAFGKNDGRKAKDSAIATRFGAIGSNWDAHLNLSLASKAEATDVITSTIAGGALNETVTQEFKGKLGVQVGGSYVYSGNNRIFGYVKHYGWKQSDSYTKYALLAGAAGGQQGTVEGDFTSYYLGWGSHYDVNTNGKIFTSLAARKTDINAKFSTKGEIRSLVLPLTIGYEAQATEWLTLRGSIVQNVYGHKDNKGSSSMNPVAKGLITKIYGADGKGTIANSTEVNAGATLTFGKLAIDGLIGTTDSTGASSKAGILSWNNLATKVAATYNF